MKPNLEKIKNAIKANGLTQAEFAAKCGITREYLTQVLNEHKEMTTRLLLQISEALNMDIDSLYMPIDVPILELPEGEAYVQCPCCKQMFAITMKCRKIQVSDSNT